MNLTEKLVKEEKELDLIKRIKEKYPLLEINEDRWNFKRMSTEEVNTIVDDVYIHHSCGCCPDAVLMARPFIKIDGVLIYSDPCSFSIGEKTYDGGDYPWDNWEDNMRKCNIPESVIEIIKEYFEKNKPDCYE